MLLAFTVVASLGGYTRWRAQEEERNKVRFERAGPVEDQRYWPPRVAGLMHRVEEEFGERQRQEVFRHTYSRRYGITDCFLRMNMTGDEFSAWIDELGVATLHPSDRVARRFWDKAPDGWLSPQDVPGAAVHGLPFIRGGRYGSQPVLLHDEARQTAYVWYVFDY